jgi:hypothetical protein
MDLTGEAEQGKEKAFKQPHVLQTRVRVRGGQEVGLRRECGKRRGLDWKVKRGQLEG